MIYLDSSALLKLIIPEAESQALAQWLAGPGHGRRSSSELTLLECARAIRSANADGRVATEALSEHLDASTRLLRVLDLLPVTRTVLETASRLSTGRLRSLDAIHVASAARYRDDLGAIITYDTRMVEAAAAAGLPTVSPS